MHDREATMAQVHALAQEARADAPHANPTEPPHTGDRVLAPIYMGKSEVIPERYVLHFKIAVCTNCGCESRESTFYALSYLKSRVNGSRVRHLTRVERPLYNIPVDRLPIGTHKTPYCAECPSIDLSHLPPPPRSENVYELAEPVFKNAKKPATPATAKAPASKPTLDDLA